MMARVRDISYLPTLLPVSYEVYPYLSGVSLRDFHLDGPSCAHAFREGGRRCRELFGEDAGISTCYCPPLSYGHLACLGAEILFPEHGAPKPAPLYDSLDEGIRALQSAHDFAGTVQFKQHLAMRDYLRAAFPAEQVGFYGFGKEGIITSAVLLRGQDFFLDMLDHPSRVREFLNLLLDSIIQFDIFCGSINGEPPGATTALICDDFAALVSPALWPEFVLPYWEAYYRATTTGARHLHCEGLSSAHLPHLQTLELSSFDPDLSPLLTPALLSASIDVSFAWSLQSFDYAAMTHADVERWVSETIVAGASSIYSYIYVNMCQGDTPAKVHTFMAAAKRGYRDNRG